LLRAHQDGVGCAFSDGSYYPNEKVGAAAWIIITSDGTTEWIEGGGVLPGPADVQNSYRSELGGQVGIASCLQSILNRNLTDRKPVCLQLAITWELKQSSFAESQLSQL